MATLKGSAVLQRALDVFTFWKWNFVLIFLLGLLIYSNTFHASFHFDDGRNIINNFAIRNLWNLKGIWDFLPNRFLTYLSLAINYHFHQLSLPGYHIFNLTVHLGTAMLVSWFAFLILSTPGAKTHSVSRHANLISLLAGLLFVSHPIQTQAVTYIIQRTASLAAFFYLLSVCLYLKSRLIQERSLESAVWVRPYVGSVLAATASFFTKELAVTLPFMLLLCEFSFFPNIPKKTAVKKVLPFFLIMSGLLALFYRSGWERLLKVRVLTEFQAGSNAIAPGQYLLTQFRVLVTYLRLLLLPVNQNLDYDYSIAQTLWQTPTLISFIFILLILAAAVVLFRKHRVLSFGIFWFFLVLAPESSIFPIRDVIFEHRLYLPMVGFSLFLPTVACYAAGSKRLKPMIIILLAVVVCYSVMTYTRNRVWKDEITLWSDVVQKSPNKARPYINRGLAYSVAGEYEKALADCNWAIRLSPSYAAAYCNRASVYHYMGRYDLAIADYTRAIELRPALSDAYYNRAFSYEKIKEYNRAIADWSQVIKFNPRDADAYYNRVVTLILLGEYERAQKDIRKMDEMGYPYNPAMLKLLPGTGN